MQCLSLVHRVIFEGKRAVGVEYTRSLPFGGPLGRIGSGVRTVRAGEVILSGGAINTPQLLQLSGIGNAGDLAALDIPVIADLPGVGENLQDHLEAYVQYASKEPISLAPSLKLRNRPKIGLEWLFKRTGPAATNHFEGGGFTRSNADVATRT